MAPSGSPRPIAAPAASRRRPLASALVASAVLLGLAAPSEAIPGLSSVGLFVDSSDGVSRRTGQTTAASSLLLQADEVIQ